MPRAFLSIGSNIDPERNLRWAVRLLGAEFRVLGLSTVYLTPAIDRPDQPSYYNCVAAVRTPLSPFDLKQRLRMIEDSLGRIRTRDVYAARTIDLDLILYEDLILHQAGLVLPDPDIVTRPFLARGLFELAPDLALPGTGARIAEVVRSFKDPAMQPLDSYTALLKGEIANGP